MHRIEFRVSEEDLGIGTAWTITPCIDGVPLPDLARADELPFARREGSPGLAGAYAGLPLNLGCWPSRHYVGKSHLSWFGDGDTVLLGCTCGDWGCWPFTATVTVQKNVVSWSHFRTGHRQWRYRKLRSLTFDRIQYERSLRATER